MSSGPTLSARRHYSLSGVSQLMALVLAAAQASPSDGFVNKRSVMKLYLRKLF